MTKPDLQQWVGRRESTEDDITPGPVARFEAVLDSGMPPPGTGTPLPPGAHWCFFLNNAPQSKIGPDGHPERGDFMPPVELPGRMFAGARYDFPGTLVVGDTVTRTSEIASVTAKSGRSGELLFVTLRHSYANADGNAMIEENDIVFRESAKPGTVQAPAKPAPDEPQWLRTIHPDPVLLFRYSAITFNSHRIHYDRTYCQNVEGYPGLVVHGPLIATLLMDLCRRENETRLTRFEFRAMSPLFDTEPFTVNAAPDNGGWKLWAANSDGGLSMQARAEFEA